MNYEVSAMITWNLQSLCLPGGHPNATTQKCQAYGYVPNESTIRDWNPSNLNTDVWVQAAVSFGAKYIILVAEHMTGFSLWNTSFHNYSITNTKRGGDVVKEMIASCKKYNVRLGVFYSVHYNWYYGVDKFKVGHPPLGPTSYTQSEYSKLAAAQLTELIHVFDDDDLFELWFDGGLDPMLDGNAIGQAVSNAAGNAICHGCFNSKAGAVRWMGNEAGVQALPSWSAVTNSSVTWSEHGDYFGTVFNPPVCDTVLRDHFWFSQPNMSMPKSTTTLVHTYLTSVGRNSNLILNVAPDATGNIPQEDLQSYDSMGKAIKCLFASSMGKNNSMLWKIKKNTKMPKNVSVVVMENMMHGQLIYNWTLECSEDAMHWRVCAMGSLGNVIPSSLAPGVGHKRILLLAENEKVVSVRVNVHDTVIKEANDNDADAIKATLDSLELFDWSGTEMCCEFGGV